MDPLAHTLFGAALAESGLKRKTAFAATALLVGANLPDVDAVTMLVNNDYALLVRRGWTHGILAMIFWPLLLFGSLRSIHNWRAARQQPSNGPPLRAGWLLSLSALAVWSHSFLDWLNTYGVRMMMPFDGRWFYGDSLFIIDPWLWLLLGSGVVLSQSRSKPGILTWTLAGIATTALVMSASVVPEVVKWIWLTWVGLILFVRVTGKPQIPTESLVKSLLLLCLLYILLMISVSRWSVSRAVESLAGKGVEALHAMAEPLPARILIREGVIETSTHYYPFRVQWPSGITEFPSGAVARLEPDEVILAALHSEGVEGFRNWARFPHYEVEETQDGWRVWIRDLRYVAPDERQRQGIGVTVIELDHSLRTLLVHE